MAAVAAGRGGDVTWSYTCLSAVAVVPGADADTDRSWMTSSRFGFRVPQITDVSWPERFAGGVSLWHETGGNRGGCAALAGAAC